jgi:hypothetical protein
MWQEEREKGTEDPEQCRHLHTDHRGSTKLIRRTFCKDCSTYIDATSKELDNELEYTVVPSEEEQNLISKFADHSKISKQGLINTAQLLLSEAKKVEEGEYSMIAAGNLFIDCADRVVEAAGYSSATQPSRYVAWTDSGTWPNFMPDGVEDFVNADGHLGWYDTTTGAESFDGCKTWWHSDGRPFEWTMSEDIVAQAVAEVPLRRLRARSRSRDNDEVKPTWTLPGRGHIRSRVSMKEVRAARHHASHLQHGPGWPGPVSVASPPRQHEQAPVPNKAGEKVSCHNQMVLMKDIQATQLRVVDPYEDPHIWAVVDDGCNSSCHTKLWRKNADKKLAKLNLQCHMESSETTTFKGVGERKTAGKWRIPFGIQSA